MIGGNNRFDTELIRICNPHLFCKGGAEGVFLFAHLKKNIVGVIKVKDGNERAISSVICTLFEKLRITNKEENSKMKKWKNSLRKKISGAAFTESIPFDETREYVKLVLSGTVIYSRLYSKQLSWNFDVRDKSILTLNSLLGSVQQ